jgi:O-antigen/teichoic acid export membrane protein
MTLGNALALVAGALLVGLKRPFATFFSDSLFRTFLIILSFPVALLALTHDGKFELLVWLVSFAYLAVGLGLTAYLVFVTREVPAAGEPRRGESRRWWRFALPWAIIVLATDFFFDLDLLFLAGIMGKEELAIFGVCARIYVLVSFGLTAVYAVTMPEIMESSAKEGLIGNAAFKKKVGDTNLAASVISLVIVVGVAVGSPLALMLFGQEFLVGVMPLTVMSICLVVRAVMGPAALALSIHDRPYTTLPAVGAGMATLVAMNLLLVPTMGLLGAAIAAMLAQSAWAISMWLIARHVTRVDVSLLPRLQELLDARRAATAARN